MDADRDLSGIIRCELLETVKEQKSERERERERNCFSVCARRLCADGGGSDGGNGSESCAGVSVRSLGSPNAVHCTIQ